MYYCSHLRVAQLYLLAYVLGGVEYAARLLRAHETPPRLREMLQSALLTEIMLALSDDRVRADRPRLAADEACEWEAVVCRRRRRRRFAEGDERLLALLFPLVLLPLPRGSKSMRGTGGEARRAHCEGPRADLADP